MKVIVKAFGFAACLMSAASLVSLHTGCAGDEYNTSTGESIDDVTITTK